MSSGRWSTMLRALCALSGAPDPVIYGVDFPLPCGCCRREPATRQSSRSPRPPGDRAGLPPGLPAELDLIYQIAAVVVALGPELHGTHFVEVEGVLAGLEGFPHAPVGAV